jgi:hypothetical protein
MARRPEGYFDQSKRYYVDPNVGVEVVLDRFRGDLETQANPAAPIASLFLAAARSVARLRAAPIDEICDHDLPFARTVQGIVDGGFAGLRFEMTRSRGYAPWVGGGVLQSCLLDEGFGYADMDLDSPRSTDCLNFIVDGELTSVDCSDMSRSAHAPTYTTLRIPTSRRREVLSRYDLMNPSAAPPPPQQL